MAIGFLINLQFDEIARQQLAEEESGLPHIIIDPSLIKSSHILKHADHEFDFCYGKCGCLTADFHVRDTYQESGFIGDMIGSIVETFLMLIGSGVVKAYRESFFICKDCGNQQKEGYP